MFRVRRSLRKESTQGLTEIDFVNYKNRINDIKRELWNWYKVDSLRAQHDYDEPVVWAYVVGITIEKKGSFVMF